MALRGMRVRSEHLIPVDPRVVRGAGSDGIGDVDPVDASLELDDLVRFVQHPVRAFMRGRLELALGDWSSLTVETDAAVVAMAVYADMIRSDPESRSRMRVTPDTIFNLPNHHAVCSWISRGARVPAPREDHHLLELGPAGDDELRHANLFVFHERARQIRRLWLLLLR